MEYISVENQKALDRRYRQTMMIVLMFGISVLICLLAAKFIKPLAPVPGSDTWMQPAYSAAIVIGLSVVVLRRIVLSNLVMRPAATRGVPAVLNTLQAMTIICSALAEMAAIAGLVLYLLTGDYQYSWRLGVVGLFLLVYSLPRRGEWERAVAESAKIQSGHPQAAKPV
jgi:hypothetical protein